MGLSHTRVVVVSSSFSDFAEGFLTVVDSTGFSVVADPSLLISLTGTARLTRRVEDDCLTQYLSNDLTKVALNEENNQ